MPERLRTLGFWTSVLLVVTVFAAVFDPAGVVVPGVKYGSVLLFALLSLVAGWRTGFASLREYDARRLVAYVAVFAVVLPVYATGVHFVRGDYPGGPWSMFAGTFIFLVLLVGGAAISGPPRRVEMAVVIALTALSIFVWIMPLLDVFLPIGQINGFGYEHHIWSYQFREYGSIKLPYLYYYTSPMLVLVVSYWGFRAIRAKKRSVDFLMACVSLSSFFLSGTRGDMIVAIILAAFFLWQISRPVFAVVVPLMMVLAVMGRQSLGQIVTARQGHGGGTTDTSTLTAQSNAIKLDYLHTYAHMFSDPVGLIFGYGTGSCVHSDALGACLPVTELTYLDTIRLFGLLGALAYAVLFIYPLWRHLERSRYLFTGWLGYLVIAGVNPYIFSTNGMTILAAVLLGAMTVPARKDPPWTFREAGTALWSAPKPSGNQARVVQVGGEERTTPRLGRFLFARRDRSDCFCGEALSLGAARGPRDPSVWPDRPVGA